MSHDKSRNRIDGLAWKKELKLRKRHLSESNPDLEKLAKWQRHDDWQDFAKCCDLKEKKFVKCQHHNKIVISRLFPLFQHFQMKAVRIQKNSRNDKITEPDRISKEWCCNFTEKFREMIKSKCNCHFPGFFFQNCHFP